MRYTTAQYAKAFSAAGAGKTPQKQREVARRFLSLLARCRALPRLERIMKEIERRERKEKGIVEIEIQSAAPIDRDTRSSVKKAAGKTAAVAVKETLRKGLLAGVRILIDDEHLIDASALRRLTTLFPRI